MTVPGASDVPTRWKKMMRLGERWDPTIVLFLLENLYWRLHYERWLDISSAFHPSTRHVKLSALFPLQ